jgi:hypothetical protein
MLFHDVIALVFFSFATPRLPQGAALVTPPNQVAAKRPSDARYGPPRLADLNSIVLGDAYERAHVLTEGEVSPYRKGEYWTLREAGAMVLLIPGPNFDANELDQATGKARIEVRGIVRRIGVQKVPDSFLPPLPSPMSDAGAPFISITVFEIRDRTSTDPGAWSMGKTGRRILDEPSAFVGKTARIVGQFRGRNLFGDLPTNSARSEKDWVLKDGDTSMWVSGKAPKGDGWKLDIDDKADSRFMLEIEGRVEVINGVVYLKASKVLMARPLNREPPALPK